MLPRSRSSRTSRPNCCVILIPEFPKRISARSGPNCVTFHGRMFWSDGSNVYNFPFSSSGSAVELRATTTLLIAILLANTGSKQACIQCYGSVNDALISSLTRTDMFCVFDTPTHFRWVIWPRKTIFSASKRSGSSMKDL